MMGLWQAFMGNESRILTPKRLQWGAGHEQAMRNFVYELIRPAILALRAFYFPLYVASSVYSVGFAR